MPGSWRQMLPPCLRRLTLSQSLHASATNDGATPNTAHMWVVSIVEDQSDPDGDDRETKEAWLPHFRRVTKVRKQQPHTPHSPPAGL